VVAAFGPSAAQDTFELVQLAPNVHVALVRPNPPRYVFANALIVIRERDVVVVDTHQSPSAARVLIDEIRKLTPLPVRYVVNTHWHGDHVYGNQSYKEQFDNVEFVGHVNTARDVKSKGAQALAQEIADLPKSIADREEWVLTGRGPNGRALAEAQVAQWSRSANLRREYLEELKALRLIAPDVTFEEVLTLSDGASPSIHLLHFGPAHTAGDVAVYLPAHRILAVGDLVENSLPWVDENSSPAGWARALNAISELEVDVIVPAHGPLLRDRNLLQGQLDFMQTISDAVLVSHRADLGLEATLARVDRLDLPWFLDPPDPRRGDTFREYIRTVATQAYEVVSVGR
jgi:glyoxylase-like metal-dependent hydrolase (beta-lactamase superfamily II)